jgi:sugar-phosphatase
MLEKVLTMFELRDSLTRWPPRKAALQQAAPAGLSGLRRKAGLDPLTCVALEDSVNGMVASKPRGCALLSSLLKKAARPALCAG